MNKQTLSFSLHDSSRPMWLYDPDSLEILEVNEPASDLYGYTRAEMEGMTLKDLTVKNEAAQVEKEAQGRLEAFDCSSVWTHRCRGDKHIRVRLVATPLKVNGQQCMLAIVNKVKEVESPGPGTRHNLLDILIEHIPGTFYIFDQQGNMKRWNKNLQRITGYQGEEIQAMNAMEFFKGPDQDKVKKAIIEGFEHGYVEVEARLYPKKGEGIPFYFSASRIEYEGTPHLIGLGIDITNQAEAQKEARKHRELLEAITEQSDSLIFVKDVDGPYRLVNKNVGPTFGYSREEMLGHTDRELFDQELAEKIIADDRAVLSSGEVKKIEEEVPTKDGDRYFYTIKYPLTDIPGYEDSICGISTDITHMKKVEKQRNLQKDVAQIINKNTDYRESIKQCVERINAFLGSRIGHVYVRSDPGDPFKYRSMELWEMSREDAIPSFIASSRQTKFKMNEGMVGKAANRQEIIIFSTEEQEYVRAESAQESNFKKGLMLPITVDDEPEIILEFYDDREEPYDPSVKKILNTVGQQISRLVERKKHLQELEEEKERYKVLAENSTDMISRHAPDGEYLYVSPACKELLGYTPDELIGTSPYDYFHPDDLDRLERKHREIMEDPQPYVISYRLKQKEGGWKWVETFGKTLRHPETGEVHEIQNATRDITNRKAYEHELQEQIGLNNDIINGLPELFFIISEDRKIQRVNDRFRGTLGYENVDIAELNSADFIAEEDRKRAAKSIKNAFETGSAEVEINLQTREGEKIPYLIHGTVTKLGDSRYILATGINIVERVEAENELKKERSFVKKAINSLPGLFYVLDKESNYVTVNESFVEELGYSREEIDEMHPLDFYREEDYEAITAAIEKAFNEGNASITARIKTKEGELPYYYLTGAHFQQDGKDYILGTGINISEKRKLEDLLQQAHEMARIGAWEYDLSTGEISWDSITREIHEVGPDFEPDLDNALAFYSEESRGTIEKAVQRAVEKGEPYDLEVQLITGEGNKRWVRTKGEPEFQEGQCVRIYGSFQDIHDRKEAEQELKQHEQLLQSMMDQASSIIYVKDKDGKFRFANDEFRKVFGLQGVTIVGASEDILLEKQRLAADYEIKNIQQLEHKTLQKGEPIELEKTLTLDGKKRTFIMSKVPLKSVEGYKDCVCSILTEITDRKRMENRLRESLEEKEVLLMEIHHRVKNNLAIISSIMQLQAIETENQEMYTALMNAQGRIHSIAIIHELLYQSESFSQVSLNENITKLVDHISSTIQSGTDITLNTDIHDIYLNVNQAIPCALVMNELLTNIYKYAFEGRKRGTINLKLKQDGDQIKLTVSDDGVGLPNDFKLKDPHSLGVKLMSVLTRQLDGELSFESEKGEGATFQLTFTKQDKKGAASSYLK